MESIKRSADFAANHIKFVVRDLNNPKNDVRVKSLKKFHEYIRTFKPEVYDDDVETLLIGNEENNHRGLIYWCGAISEKNDGQLKRICSSVLACLRTILTIEYPDENIFSTVFATLPVETLTQIRFTKHILPDQSSSVLTVGRSKSPSADDACEVLSILMNLHQNAEGEQDLMDVDVLLDGNIQCRDFFLQWLQRTAAEISSASSLVAPATRSVVQKRAASRPETWGGVRLKSVPLMDDEKEEDVAEVDSGEVEADMALPDPLGISSVDLRSVSTAQREDDTSADGDLSAGKAPVPLDKRSSMSSKDRLGLMRRLQSVGLNSTKKTMTALGSAKKAAVNSDKAGAKASEKSSDSNGGDKDNSASTTVAVPVAVDVESILPTHKNFSPGLLLSLIHGMITVPQLQTGLKNLEVRLLQQSSRREDLVRQHYGLFVHCAEGLDWLKSFKQQSGRNSIVATGGATNGRLRGGTSSLVLELKQNKLPQAIATLKEAKGQAQNILAPILDRMKRARNLKNADQILRRIGPALEYPHIMQRMLAAGEYENILTLYHRVQALPHSSGLRILSKVFTRTNDLIADMKSRIVNQLLASQPVFPVLNRLVKILAELESDEEYRSILVQCFDKQISLFEEDIKHVEECFREDFLKAFMRGHDMNLASKDPAGNSQPSRSSSIANTVAFSFEKKLQSQPSNRSLNPKGVLRRQRSNSGNVSENGDIASAENEALSAAISSDREWMALLQDDDGDMVDSEDEDVSLPPPSVRRGNSSSSIGYSSSYGKKREGEGAKGDLQLDPNVDYSEVLCSYVRLAHVRDLLDSIDGMLPGIHKLLFYIKNVGVATSKIYSSPRKMTKITSSSASVGVGFNRNQQVSNYAKQVGEVLTRSADLVRNLILGFPDSKGSSGMASLLLSGVNALSAKGMAGTRIYQIAIREPFLMNSVIEVSSLYEAMDAALSTGDSAGGGSFGLDDDSSRYFGSSRYRDAFNVLRDLAEDGENALAKRTTENILSFVVKLTSPVSGIASSLNRNGTMAMTPMTSPAGKSSQQLAPAGKDQDINEIIRVFELYVSKRLQLLSSMVRRPDWVTKNVWDGMHGVIEKFINCLGNYMWSEEELSQLKYQSSLTRKTATKASISLSACSPPASPTKNPSPKLDKASSVVGLESILGELDSLESSLLDINRDELTKKKNLEFIKACVQLRTSAIPKIWQDTKFFFALSDENLPANTIQNLLADNVDGNREEDDWEVNEAKAAALDITDERNIDELQSSMRLISVLEENAVIKFLGINTLYFRTGIQSAYSAVVKAEMSYTWKDIVVHQSENIFATCVPPHISRLLLELGKIQMSLRDILQCTAIPPCTSELGFFSETVGGIGGSDPQAVREVRYESFLLSAICLSILDIYSDLINSLLENSFSLHSSGRVSAISRLSNMQSSSDKIAAGGPVSRYPISAGQAIEEFEFLKTSLRPMFLWESKGCAINFPTRFSSSHIDMCSQKYPSSQELWSEAKLFVIAVTKRASVKPSLDS